MIVSIRTCLLFVALLVAGCDVTGPRFREAGGSIPPVPAEQGRIYFYRAAGFVGGGLRPPVVLDGLVVGQSLPGGVFYRDVTPGKHRVQIMTETTKSVDVAMGPGESKYIKMEPAFGWAQGRVEVTVVDTNEAQTAIQDLALTDASP